MDLNADVLVSLVALGMGIAFVSADRNSPASRALAAGFAFIGLSILLNVVVMAAWPVPQAWSGWFAWPEALAIVCVLGWILRVRRTLPVAPGVDTRAGDRALRVGQLCGLFYGIASVLEPELRLQAFIRAGELPRFYLTPGFWLFMGPVLLAMLAGLAGILLLLNRRPDRAEAVRVVAMALATPMFVAGFVLPIDYAALVVVIGEMIFLVGAVHYHVLQGQRGQFMSRFLSPQVARLVSERGLDQAMRESSREISVVCCDLRGFTRYAAAHPSSQVLAVLREYYDDVGCEAASFGATIKDFAGDGVLILVGAPLPVAYHAARAIELAQRIRIVGAALCGRWERPGHRLGIGVGVATGMVTVGIIGSASRLEYTAVGSAVNLASRLCELAGDGEILVDARTAELAGDPPLLQSRPPAALKGFAGPVAHHAVPA
ncbi:adenylate/guanylate cyclase domain-containing protein [Sinimarinibacterium flocculans]|uniref:adenylate/guanylate cyclase domain-containing protein n=1 Tax=Sinimarinibacterium flocculans TaxID=985250 RepID=UPI002493CCB1|nr:adenylate/guanylate cyclase domain-containing protein [Sinimarinibacterium flocculans]